MSVVKVNDIFSDEEYAQLIQYTERRIAELDHLQEVGGNGKHEGLGRYQIGNIPLNKSINDKIINLAEEITGKRLKIDHCLYAEYSKDFGQPNLPPHFDGDNNELVIDFQLTANTSWNLGIETEEYTLENNSALIFNANEHPHWRPNKVFSDGESVKMLFWRLYDPDNRVDYSDVRFDPTDPIFDEINKVRGGTNGIQ